MPKGAFYEKKVVLGNVKHFGDKKDIFLSKSGPNNSMYSNVDSLSGNDENVDITGVNSGSLLGSAAITSKIKHINTGVVFGSPLGSPDFTIDDDNIVFSPHLLISLEKKWIDPKIVKIPVEMLVRKFFTLDINFLAVDGKSTIAKTQFIRKIFLLVNSFGKATTPSKFEEIIRSIFTSENSMEKAMLLVKEKRIVVNTDLKRQEIHLDQAVVIKKIPMNMPKDMIIAALAEFDSVHVVIAVDDYETWVSRDRFKALLFTLPVEISTHDLGTLLNGAGRKICVINCSMNSSNWVCCAVVGFKSEEDLKSAYCTELIFGSVKLSWTRLDLVRCEKCGHFGHSALECNTPTPLIFKSSKPVKKVSLEGHHFRLVKLYTRKGVPISKPAVFVVLLAFPSSGSHFDSGFGPSSSPFGSSSIKKSPPVVQDEFLINDHLTLLECSLELLANQVSDIVHRLNSVELVLLVLITQVVLLATSVFTLALPDTDMVLNVLQLFFLFFFSVLEDKVVDLGLSSSKVLTSKVGNLESKMMALKVFIGSILGKVATCNVRGMSNLAKQEDIVYWHKDSENMILIVTEMKLRSDIRLWVFTSGLDVGFYDAGIAIIMNNFLAQHVLKVDEIPGHLISVCFLFKNKLLVTILGLYTGMSIGTQFSQAADINFMVSKMVNSSFFVVLSGDFNENRSNKSVSFKFCLGLGLVNIFNGHLLAKTFT
ncbi:hypothetical protein G9A89_014069 [Geosiphon pyriformis]|nr:hypothetical protein G9A89_014069 [Geosiphon pyriformis]